MLSAAQAPPGLCCFLFRAVRGKDTSETASVAAKRLGGGGLSLAQGKVVQRCPRRCTDNSFNSAVNVVLPRLVKVPLENMLPVLKVLDVLRHVVLCCAVQDQGAQYGGAAGVPGNQGSREQR